MYIVDGQFYFLNDGSPDFQPNRTYSPPDPDALNDFYRSEAEGYCELLRTAVQESDCTPEGVARLNELYKQMMAERRAQEMFGMLGRVRQDAENELTQQQFEAMIIRRSGPKETE